VDVDLAELTGRMQKSEFRLTPQRRLILRVLYQHKNEHFTADELYHWVNEEDSGLGLATIYRNLAILEKVGIVSKLRTEEEANRYELATERPGAHVHFVCRSCGQITELEDCLPRNAVEDMIGACGLEVEEYSVTLYGSCRECAGTSSKPK